MLCNSTGKINRALKQYKGLHHNESQSDPSYLVMAASQPIVLQQLTSNATGSPNPTDESPPLDMAPSQVHEGQPDQSYPIMAVARPIVPQQLTNSATDSPNQTASISESPPLPDTAPSQVWLTDSVNACQLTKVIAAIQ